MRIIFSLIIQNPFPTVKLKSRPYPAKSPDMVMNVYFDVKCQIGNIL